MMGFHLKMYLTMIQTVLKYCFASLKTQMDEKYKKSIQAFEKEGVDFLKKNENKKGVKQTFSGLQYKVLKKGMVKSLLPHQG